MKLTNAELMSFANALELLSPSMGRTQQMAMGMASPDAPQFKTPRVKGNLNYPLLIYRVGRARIAIKGAVEAFTTAQASAFASHRIPPEKQPGEPMPPEDQWPSDGRAVAEALKPILAEEIDVGELKPLTWDILKKAGIVGGTPAGENEIEFDGSFVAALGDFLAGEPPEDAG